jgi:hypothetical protein
MCKIFFSAYFVSEDKITQPPFSTVFRTVSEKSTFFFNDKLDNCRKDVMLPEKICFCGHLIDKTIFSR